MKKLSWAAWLAIILVGLPIISILAFIAWFDADEHRQTLEQLVAENTPLELSIDAPIEYSLKDPYLITFRQLALSFEGEPLLALDRFALRIEKISLLNREITIAGISLDRPNINLSPARLDRLIDAFASQSPPADPSLETEEAALILSALSLNNLNIDGLSLRWDDLNKPLRLKELTLAVTDWHLIRDAKLDLNHWKMAIKLTAEQLNYQNITADNLALNALLSDANIELQDAKLEIFSGSLQLAASTSLTGGFATTIHTFSADNLVLSDELLGTERPAETSAQAGEAETEQVVTHKPLIPTISTPISSLVVEDFQINNLNATSKILAPGLILKDFSLALNNTTLIANSQFAPETFTGKINSRLKELSYEAHKVTDLETAISADKGFVKLEALSAKVLDGDIKLAATTDLTQDLATEILSLHLEGLKINDSLWQAKGEETTAAIDPKKESKKSENTKPEAIKVPIRSLFIHSLTTKQLELAVNTSGQQLSTKNFDLSLSQLSLIDNYTAAAYPSILAQPFKLTVNSPETLISDVKLHTLILDAQGGKPFKVNKLSSRSDYGAMDINAEIKTQTKDLAFTSQVRGKQLELSTLDFLDTGYPMSGKADLNASLSGSAASADALIASLNGPVQLKTKQFTLHNIDLDMTLNHFLDSQELTLLDIGAFALLGPIGLAVSKGKAFSGAAAGALAGGETKISQTDINLEFNNGVIKFGPSAIATVEHRIAMFGKINLPEKRFELLRTAVLDEQACVRLARSIDGPFSGPDVQIASAITGTITGLLSGAFAGTEKFFGKNCEPVYAGPVKPPKQFDFEANAKKLEEEEAALLKKLPPAAQQAEQEMQKSTQQIVEQTVEAEKQN